MKVAIRVPFTETAMSSPNGIEPWQVALEILRYVAVNPEARSTPEAIRDWWVGDLHAVVDVVIEALEKLVAMELMERHTGLDGRSTYGINAFNLARIEDLIRDSER